MIFRRKGHEFIRKETQRKRIYPLRSLRNSLRFFACKKILLLLCFFALYLTKISAQLPKNIQKIVAKAESEMVLHNYQKAYEILLKTYQNNCKNSSNSNYSNCSFLTSKIDQCSFGITQINNPNSMFPVNLGKNVNSAWNEYHPSLTGNSKHLLYTVRKPSDSTTTCLHCKEEEDIYLSVQEIGIWQARSALPKPIKTGNNEGAQCISADGNYLFLTICTPDMGFGSCDIYWSKLIDNEWTNPINCGVNVNSRYWESQPSLQADGKTLYFCSNRPGGIGGIDLWKTVMISEGVFSEPVNLGTTINTPFDELSPFIHFDQKTLYFASDGHLGMGGTDLFFAKKKGENSWSKPTNLGYPINSYQNESGIFINAQGNAAYFSSNRSGGFGGLDLYCFELAETLRPEPVLFTVEEIIIDPVSILILDELTALEVGETFIIPNIFFEFAQSNLMSESYIELKKVINFLESNPTISIAISGHTDDQGAGSYNLKLSEARAFSVYLYLVDNGIEKSRLKFHGEGENNPLVPNISDESRAKNRRTEIKILEK